MDPGVLALGHPDPPSPPHPLGLELGDDATVAAPIPYVHPQLSSPSTHPLLAPSPG